MKDPAYPDTRYVVDLVAPGVVNTMPEGTLRAVADHGVIPADSIRAYYPGAQRVLVRLAAVGIDYQDVVQSLGVLQLARRGIGLVISRRRRPGKSAPHSRRGPVSHPTGLVHALSVGHHRGCV